MKVALPLAGAVRLHAAAVHLGEVPDERQADAEAAVGAATGAVRLPEAVEDEREQGGDARPGVADDHLDVRVDPPHADVHASAARRELHRIR